MKQLVIHHLISDEVFWTRFKSFSFDTYLKNRLLEYRAKGIVPGPKILLRFAREYKILENDTRSIDDIRRYLLSEKIHSNTL